MKYNLSNLSKAPLFLVGLGLLAVSTVVFCLPIPNGDLPVSFLTTYVFLFIYFLCVVNENKRATGRYFKFSNLPHNVILLLLANLSAYSLNLGVPVFEPSTTWFSAFLALLNLALLVVAVRRIAQDDDSDEGSPDPAPTQKPLDLFTQMATFGVDVSGEQASVEASGKNREPADNSRSLQFAKIFQPDILNHVLVATICAGLLFQAYLAIYVAPFLPFALLVFWFFGISLHLFVPVFFFLGLWLLTRKFVAVSPAYWRSAIVGAALPVAFILGFIFQTNGIVRSVEEVHHQTIAPLAEEGLPEWAMVGQRLDGEDWMVKRIVNGGLLRNFGFGIDARMRRSRFMSEEGLRHEPILAIASFFVRRGDLSEENLERLRTALFNSRHVTEPRLWSGEDLRTRDIVTNVQLFPAHRLAYTEKTLLIENVHQWSENQQEAIYSFYLPEGSVVTSASLWIGDHEEKAYLTTRQKADTAYQTIVGRERKDPMLVRWQEGNRVSVRVFPCTPKEPRKFKIGITSPLRSEAAQLIYENIDFEGCEKDGARETVQVLTEGGDPAHFSASLALENKGGFRHFSGNYQPDWSLKFKAPDLSESSFTFNGRSFQMRPVGKDMEQVAFDRIYLDINDGWTKSQFNAIWEAWKHKEIYAWSGGMVRLNQMNKNGVFKQLNRLNYSLFPFDKIFRPEQSVVVTAACGYAPVLGDLDTCAFAKNVLAFFSKQEKPVRVVNLTPEISPFIKSLAETRSVQVYVKNALPRQEFPAWEEDAQTVVIGRSGLKIKALDSAADAAEPISTSISNVPAPDHLLRLFAYNDLMKRLGKDYFDKKSVQEALIAQATEAYVVSPVSSLISLETQQDYERFDIQKAGENSLQNASIKSSGAVPEPEEWLLLAVCFGVAVALFWRKWQ